MLRFCMWCAVLLRMWGGLAITVFLVYAIYVAFADSLSTGALLFGLGFMASWVWIIVVNVLEKAVARLVDAQNEQDAGAD